MNMTSMTKLRADACDIAVIGGGAAGAMAAISAAELGAALANHIPVSKEFNK